MGCGSSRSSAVVAPVAMPTAPVAAAAEGESPNQSVEATPEKATATHTRVKEEGPTGGIIRVKEMPGSCDSLPTESQYGSSESVTESTKSAGEYRNGSAKSTDSGLGRDSVIITESSNETMKDVAKVPEDLPEPDLSVDGKQMRTPPTMGHRRRSNGRLPPVHPNSQRKLLQGDSPASMKKEIDDLEAILQKRVQFADELINELPTTSSIVKRPVSRGGVAFDIATFSEENNSRSRSRKPPCVLKYAQHRRAAEVVTHAELDEKQKAADQRRKEHEQMRMERIWAQQEKDRQVAEALAKFAAMQTGLKSEKAEKVAEKTPPRDRKLEDRPTETSYHVPSESREPDNNKNLTARPAQQVDKRPHPKVGKKKNATVKTGSITRSRLIKAN